MSCSASSTVEILSIAALAACTWPYSSESSWSGWKTSCSIPTAAISVPISSEPPSIMRAPAKRTATVAIDAEQLDRREEDRRELLRVGVRDAVRLVQLLELALERALAVERLHDGHPGDRLGELRGDRGDPRADVGERRVRAPLEPARDDDPRRQHEQRDEPEAPVEQEQAADRGDERQRVHDERRQPLVEHVGERVDVARQARDDPARLLLREVPERERREVVEEVAPELEHHPLPDAGEHQPRRRAEDPRDDADRDVDRDVAREAAARRRR